MTTKEEEKKETSNAKKTGSNRKQKTANATASFNPIEYIEKTFDKPKAFIYYTVVNELKFKNKEEVTKAYELFKQLEKQ